MIYLPHYPSPGPSAPNSVSSRIHLFSFPQTPHVLPSRTLHMLTPQSQTFHSHSSHWLCISCCNKLRKLSSFKQDILIISQFLWFRNPETAQRGGSDSGSLMRLQSSCCPALLCVGLQNPLSRWFTQMATGSKSQFLPSYWQRPQLLVMWTSPCDRLRVLTPCQLTSPKTSDSGESKPEVSCLL